MEDVWVFGYGSLIWRPSFPFEERRKAWISGFARRLWQGSDDHRGVPGALGRVVTLVPMAESRTVGVAFRIAGPNVPEVLDHLDWREKNGYERHLVDLHGDDDRSFARGVVFVAGALNPHFLGDAPLDALVRQIAGARGPSGENREYVVELAQALRALGAPDDHLESIVERLEQLPPDPGLAEGSAAGRSAEPGD